MAIPKRLIQLIRGTVLLISLLGVFRGILALEAPVFIAGSAGVIAAQLIE